MRREERSATRPVADFLCYPRPTYRKKSSMIVDKEYLEGQIKRAEDGIADRHAWFRRKLISAETRDLDIKRFENQKATPQVLLDIINGVPIKLPDGL